MKIHIIAYPYGRIRESFTIEIFYENKNPEKCPLFSKDGTFTVPSENTHLRNLPLDEGFTFSGLIFKEPIVDEEKEEVSIHMTDILISRDGVLHPEILPGDIVHLLGKVVPV